MSYEDMLEAADFEERYEARVVGEEETNGRPCWKLEGRAVASRLSQLVDELAGRQNRDLTTGVSREMLEIAGDQGAVDGGSHGEERLVVRVAQRRRAGWSRRNLEAKLVDRGEEIVDGL